MSIYSYKAYNKPTIEFFMGFHIYEILIPSQSDTVV